MNRLYAIFMLGTVLSEANAEAKQKAVKPFNASEYLQQAQDLRDMIADSERNSALALKALDSKIAELKELARRDDIKNLRKKANDANDKALDGALSSASETFRRAELGADRKMARDANDKALDGALSSASETFRRAEVGADRKMARDANDKALDGALSSASETFGRAEVGADRKMARDANDRALDGALSSGSEAFRRAELGADRKMARDANDKALAENASAGSLYGNDAEDNSSSVSKERQSEFSKFLDLSEKDADIQSRKIYLTELKKNLDKIAKGKETKILAITIGENISRDQKSRVVNMRKVTPAEAAEFSNQVKKIAE